MGSEGLCCSRDKQIDTRSELTTGGLWEYNMEENPIRPMSTLLILLHNPPETHTHAGTPPPQVLLLPPGISEEKAAARAVVNQAFPSRSTSLPKLTDRAGSGFFQPPFLFSHTCEFIEGGGVHFISVPFFLSCIEQGGHFSPPLRFGVDLNYDTIVFSERAHLLAFDWLARETP